MTEESKTEATTDPDTLTATGDPDGLAVVRNRVVGIRYAMRSAAGEVLEDTFAGEPTMVLYGQDGLIKGLSDALSGKHPGARFTVDLPPALAFGERDDSQTQRISKKHFPKGQKFAPGDVTALKTEQGTRPVTVIKVGRTVVDVDLNHPRAGEHLTMDVLVESVREATPEERSHGHAHGPGGHQH